LEPNPGDVLMKFLTSPWFSAPVGAIVYLASTFLFWKTPALPPPVKTDDQPVLSGPSWEFSNPEADQLIAQLRDEKKAMDAREQKLQEWQQSLDAQKLQLNMITQAVWQLQTDFDRSVVRVSEEETTNLKRLAKIYADMKPADVATIMGPLDDVVIVKTMLFMKENESAAILEIFAKGGPEQAKRASQIAEHVRLSIAHASPTK
jgi:flagellar motility protein MotE (MotC chaperone)